MSRFFSYVYLYPLLRSNQHSINLFYREFEKKYLNDKKNNEDNKDTNNNYSNMNIYKYFINNLDQKINKINYNKPFNQKEAYDKFCFVCMMYI
jgi:6-pyruvoyl-tetrahydropterin synthase